MSSLNRLLQGVSKQFLPGKTEVFLDLGSGSAKIYINGKQVAKENSRVVFHERREIRKKGELTQVKFIVQRGSITDYDLAREFLNNLLKTEVIGQGVEPRFIGVFLLPSEASQADGLIAQKVLDSLDYGRWKLIRKKVSAKSKKGCVIDIGFDLTEVILNKNTAKTIKFGSRTFTKKIREVVRHKYHIDISWQAAEKIKLALKGDNFLVEGEKTSQKISVRGKDVNSFVPLTVIVESKDLRAAMASQVDDLFDEIKLFFSKISVDVLMNSIERGIELWGDGSRLAGLEEYLARKLQTEVTKGTADYASHS